MGDAHPQPLAPWRAAPPPLTARLAWLGISLAVLNLAAVYVKIPVLRPGVTVGDLIDIATPVILVFLYALVVRAVATAGSNAGASTARFRAGPRMLLAIGGFALVLGHGMHVAANSIHDAIARAGIQDPGGLVNWWDERVSHLAIDGSKVAMCLGLTALERGKSAEADGLLWLGAAAYGFIYFAGGVEGQTVMLLLPFCAAYIVWSVLRGRPFPPVRRFYTLGALVSVVLFAVWGIWHRGFPEFSAVGLIP